VNAFNLSAWAVKHKAVVLYLILVVGAAGLYAYLGMGRAEDPSFTIKTMIVSVNWPGATSDEVQRQVADKIEEKLQETRASTTCARTRFPVRRSSRSNSATTRRRKPCPTSGIRCGRRWGTSSTRWPEGVTGPFLDDEYGDVYVACTLSRADYTPAELKRIAEDARQRLLRGRM